MTQTIKSRYLYILVSLNIIAISIFFILNFQKETITLTISIFFLTLSLSALYIMFNRQRQKIKALNRKNKELTDSRDSSLEYIDALWASQQGIIQDEKLSSLNSLVSGIAHELNTPLGVSLTALSYLEDVIHSEEGKSLLDDAKPMLDLTMNNLLKSISLVEKFTEISGGNAEDDSSPVEISEFVDFACCRVSTNNSFGKMHTIKLDLPENLWINISQMSLSIVVKNIIENAFEFAFKEDEFGEVTITTEQHVRDLILIIRDDGVGIAEKEVKHIFDPFYTTRRADNHYGLGLAISYNLLSRYHNGNISCKPARDGGTEFAITIPDAICLNPNK
ncbi:MAG: HAMP domain-containing histidine kinase [Spirochaetaceae bacterium]